MGVEFHTFRVADCSIMVNILKEKLKRPDAFRLDVVPAIASLVLVLAWSCVVLLLVHVLLTVLHYEIMELPWLVRGLFDVDEEESVPTWFSSMVLLLTAFYLTFVSLIKLRVSDLQARSWASLSLGFFFLSIDEVAGFHEAINSVMDASWAVPGGLLALILLFTFAKFLRTLPGWTSRGFIFAGAIYVGGAIGVELATEPYLYNDELDTLAYNLWTAVEEGMEMGGVIYFLYVLNQYVDRHLKPVLNL